MPAGLCGDAKRAPQVFGSVALAGVGHHFLGASSAGLCGIVESTGNKQACAILRFPSAGSPSATAVAVAACAAASVWIAELEPSAPDGGEPHAVRRFVTELCGESSAWAWPPSPTALCGVRLGASGTAVANLAAALQLIEPLRRRAAQCPPATVPRESARAAPPPRDSARDNLRIRDVRPLLPPAILLEEQPRLNAHAAAVRRGREQIGKVLSGELDRLIVVCGPPVVDDASTCAEFAARLAPLAQAVADDLVLVMRCQVAAEPTQPASGATPVAEWAGPLMDPERDGSFRINSGLRLAREMLLLVSQLGLPLACELYDPITPQYIADLLSWVAVPAASVTLRELVSGLSMPAGLRTTAADADPAVLQRAAEEQTFIGVTTDGIAGIVHARGNSECALQLRCDMQPASLPHDADERGQPACEAIFKSGVPLILELGGAGVEPEEQLHNVDAVVDHHLFDDGSCVRGVCLSSYIISGSQRSLPVGETGEPPLAPVRGLSLREPCLGWERTQKAVRALADAVRARRARRQQGEGHVPKRPRQE